MLPILVIEDSTIAKMVQDPAFADIPCLANKKDAVLPANTGCGSCAKSRATKQRETLREIKTCLSHLGAGDREKLKTLLNTAKIKIIAVSHTGQALTTVY